MAAAASAFSPCEERAASPSCCMPERERLRYSDAGALSARRYRRALHAKYAPHFAEAGLLRRCPRTRVECCAMLVYAAGCRLFRAAAAGAAARRYAPDAAMPPAKAPHVQPVRLRRHAADMRFAASQDSATPCHARCLRSGAAAAVAAGV